jgi:hypothetical protein
VIVRLGGSPISSRLEHSDDGSVGQTVPIVARVLYGRSEEFATQMVLDD